MKSQGDFNGKIGNENENGTDRVMGKEGLGTKNEGGEQLIELCVNNDLFIGGSAFAHKDIIKIHGYLPMETRETKSTMYV